MFRMSISVSAARTKLLALFFSRATPTVLPARFLQRGRKALAPTIMLVDFRTWAPPRAAEAAIGPLG